MQIETTHAAPETAIARESFEAPETRTFAIVLSKKDSVEKALTKIVKRAEKRGLALPSWTWGEVTTRKETHYVPHPDYPSQEIEIERMVTRIALVLSSAPVRYDGWAFLAAIAHFGEEGNLVRAKDEGFDAAPYRHVKGNCDHCGHKRNRAQTYLLAHTDGTRKQVGSTCIDDFLGGSDALKIASYAEILFDLRSACADGEDLGSGGSSKYFALDHFLVFVAGAIRLHGWTSKKAAYEGNGTATANRAAMAMHERDTKSPHYITTTREDETLSAQAIEWAKNLSDNETDRSDYLFNVRLAARLPYLDRKFEGIAASIITAYQRAMGEIQARKATLAALNNVHMGNVGDRVTFGLAPKLGKKGQPLKNAPIVLSPEHVTLVNVSGYEGAYGYTTILVFRTTTGETIVWKASGFPLDSSGKEITKERKGESFALMGKIKAHDEYKGVKQTKLSHCSVILPTAKE